MIPSRPLPLVDIISETLSIYGRSFARFALFFLILFVPGVVAMTAGVTEHAQDFIAEARRDIGINDSDLTVLRNDFKAWLIIQNPMFATQWPMSDTTHFPHARTRQIFTYVETDLSRSSVVLSPFVLGLLLLIIGTIALVAVTVDLACQVFEVRPQEFWGSLRNAFTMHIWKMLLLYILYLAVSWSIEGMLLLLPEEIGGILTSFITGVQIYVLIRFAAVIPALVSEGLGPFRALARSWELTRRAGWRIFGASFAFGIILFLALMLVSMVASLVPGDAFSWLNEFFVRSHLTVEWFLQTFPAFVRSVAFEMSVVVLLLFSLAPIFTTVLYYDLRTRHDGPLVYLED